MTRFGHIITLEDREATARNLARACFDALPDLREIQQWTIRRSEPAAGPGDLAPGETEFWMMRQDKEHQEFLELCDISSDTAAAAIGRFFLGARELAVSLSARLQNRSAPTCLIHYRSGNCLLIEDVDTVFSDDPLAPKEFDPGILGHLHPVFENDVSAHERMSWLAGIGTDLAEIDIRPLLLDPHPIA